jgi:3-phenylpropionate/cinnamic acid dioxygenase small subunit
MSDATTHRFAINDLLARFFQAFDDKNWRAMRACLCDELFADYASFRGVPASMMPADEYVAQRRTALQALDMQHNFLNLQVEVAADASTATARCNYIVHRFHPSFDGVNDHHFHSYGHYLFAFANVRGAWRIARITQRALRSQGRRELHPAATPPRQAES